MAIRAALKSSTKLPDWPTSSFTHLHMKVKPSREERKECYDGRDNYFKCLDQNGLILDGLANGPNILTTTIDSTIDPKLIMCGQLRVMFEKNCLKSWSEHFASTRIQELQKDYLIQKMVSDAKSRDDGSFWQKVKEKE